MAIERKESSRVPRAVRRTAFWGFAFLAGVGLAVFVDTSIKSSVEATKASKIPETNSVPFYGLRALQYTPRDVLLIGPSDGTVVDYFDLNTRTAILKIDSTCGIESPLPSVGRNASLSILQIRTGKENCLGEVMAQLKADAMSRAPHE